MAAFRTLELLPSVFRTEANSKFLNATLDQLVSEPALERINGYVGRRFASSFQFQSSFIQEPTAARQNYQLEPSVIVDKNSVVEFSTGYQDFINKIQYLGGEAQDHSRLFENEFYSFDGLIDFDKCVNFNQYYWVPAGIDTVPVTIASGVNIEEDILGNTEYTTENLVKFTNGLSVTFDNTVIPSSYRNTEYYVEGVGSAIKLVPVAELITPELFASEYATRPDYITINRASIDRNPWSRSNRWFHVDVINQAAEYNNSVAVLAQSGRALRPIIEFEANTQLFDYGNIAQAPVDLIDFTTTDVFSNLEYQIGASIAGVELAEGMRIIFAAETDILVKDKVYLVSFIDPDNSGTPRLHFSLAADTGPTLGGTVLVKQGVGTTGIVYRYTTAGWQLAQQKTSLQQAPRFDVFDKSGTSFSDQLRYPNNTFTGTSIFGYQTGTGRIDAILGFPLRYRNISNIGDIVFDNRFDQDSFIYTQDNNTREVKINTGFLHVNTGADTFEARNVWSTVSGKSFQYQVISYDVSGTSYRLDVEPASLDPADLKVYLDNKKLATSDYTFVPAGKQSQLILQEQVILNKSRLDVKIRSNQTSSLGFYEIPANLEFNAQNTTFDSLTLGQMRGHVQAVYDDLTTVVGVFPGSSNLRDIAQAKTTPGTILQHSAGLPYAMLFLVNEKLDFFTAVQQASFDYSKFKFKFLDLATSISSLDLDNIPGCVDEILQTINEVKTPDFPYYYTDMVAYGEKVRIDTEISFLGQNQIGLPENFDLAKSGFRAVLVYLNNTQLVESRDYEFLLDSGVVVLSDSLTITIGDRVRVDYYDNTLGSWVPATPSKLGLWPRFQPELFQDDTMLVPALFIRGHDGSLTPAFGDFRDDLLLELEKRIYNNIKTTYDLDRVNIFDVLPGRGRETGFTLGEINQILSTQFFKWSGTNRLNYSSNTIYDRTNPFTYNYKRSADKLTSETMPGSWRAVYDYYFDTQRPHTHPWEMLGFSIKPTWWESQYGAAPYTSSNQTLWADLQAGLIAHGDRAGIDARFARAYLGSMIPVDSMGNLLAPSDFIVKINTPTNADISWAVGDQGPGETAWRRSSEFAFAAQMLLAVTKPARYFGENLDREKYNKSNVLGQYLFSDTNQRITPSDIEITGISLAGRAVSKSSYINWVADFIQSQSQDPGKTLKNLLDNFDIQLSYKMAAYSDKKYLKVFAEQVSPTSTSDSIVIPDEDYRVHLQKSTPIARISYSGVIVTKTPTGYRVDGLDLNRPYFTIVPSQVNNNSYAVPVLNSTGVVYRDYQRVLITVPYGYEFATRQQIFDFLISYGRFLNSQGFVFTDLLSDVAETRNWVLSGKEFLFWSQQGWPADSMLFLSPVGTRLRLRSNLATVNEIRDTQYASRVLDQNLRVIARENYVANRQDNDFTLETTSDQIIGFAEFETVQYEHALIFNNTTMFNDIIYVPELGSRQSRMKLVGFRTSDWNGTLSPAGFVFNQDVVEEWAPGRDYVRGTLVQYKNQYYIANQTLPASDRFEFSNWKTQDYSRIKKGLIPNFANSAENFTTFYDVNGINLENQYDLLGKGLIGYRSRKYFADLGIDDTSQVKFYQGFIREKGTKRSFDALIGAEFDNASSEIVTREEWAVRVGEYGAVDSRQVLELVLDEGKVTANPAKLELLDESASYPLDSVGYRVSDVYRKPNNYTPDLFLTLENDQEPEFEIKTAGYLQVSDVDFTLFDLRDYTTLEENLEALGIGKAIWVAQDFDANWNVFRVSETGVITRKISNLFDQTVLILTNGTHGLVENDIIVIKNFTNGLVFNGVHQVVSVPTATEFTIAVPENLALDDFLDTEPQGALYKMQSLRLVNLPDIFSATPRGGWKTSDRFFIDQYGGENYWAVFEKNTPWANTYNYADNIPETQRGTTVAINDQSQLAIVGSAEYNTGEIVILATNAQNRLRELARYTLNATSVLGFGSSLDIKQTTALVGAPESDNTRGYVTVLDLSQLGQVRTQQVFTTPDLESAGRFGATVVISADSRWLYVAAPEINSVYAYTRTRVPSSQQRTVTLLGDGSTLVFGLGFVPLSTQAILVRNLFGKIFVAGVDFTIDGSSIIFATAPDLAESITLLQRGEYYEFVTKIQSVDSNAGDKFGHSLSTSQDGTRVIIGAPFHEYDRPPRDAADLTDAGAVYVYDRSVEAFFGGEETYQSSDSFANIISVRLNDIILTPVQDYSAAPASRTVTLTQATETYDTVYLETNNFSLVDKLTSQNPEQFNNFGFSAVVCRTDCSIYVGSPSTDTLATNSGSVYRYINAGKTYGSVLGTVANPTLTPGDSFRINDFTMQVTTSDLASLVLVINNRQIPGIRASILDNRIVISSSSDAAYDKLKISHGSGSVLSDLGIDIYTLAQIIANPQAVKNEYFGETLAVTPDSRRLLVGSPSATSRFNITFDAGTTTFDVNSTTVTETIANSGSVQVFEYLSNLTESREVIGLMTLGQELISNTLSLNDRFGQSLAASNSVILVGAPRDSTQVINQGVVNVFQNLSGKNCYELVRQQQPRINTDSINKIFIYNRERNQILSRLDFIDPVKGKLLGAAAENLDYITAYDPARYNQTSFGTITTSLEQAWGPEQVGLFWWNLGTARFLDYEQGSLDYRAANWGKLFPGSQVEVYEWIVSNYPPSEYSETGGSGTPKSTDNTEYCEEEYLDSATGSLSIRYYYWVKNRNAVALSEKQKTRTSAQVASLIENPATQGGAFAAILKNNAVSLYNVREFLSARTSVLHIDYDVKINDDNLHTEFELLEEGASRGRPNKRILNKIQDSLAGINAIGQSVPDSSLPAPEQLGILTRPRQSTFIDRIGALKQLVSEVNKIFAREKIAQEFDLDTLNSFDPIPRSGLGLWDEQVANLEEFNIINFAIKPLGHRVLVEFNEDLAGRWCIFEKKSDTQVIITQVQSYDVRRYWEKINWYAAGYSSTTVPDFVVANRTQLIGLTLEENNTVKLLDNGESQFVLLRATATGVNVELETVGIQRGTIRLLTTLYENPTTGFDATSYDAGLFDESLPQIEVRLIFQALRDDILVSQLNGEFNKLFFMLLKYAVSEQLHLDWAFKTSFITVFHKIRKLEEFPTFRRDNQQFLLDYLTEAKPYRSKIREYVLDYDRTDVSNTAITDFDAQNSDTQPDWQENYTLVVGSIDILNAGTGYTSAPDVVISQGGGLGASAVATVLDGEITAITVTDPGSGYTSQPIVEILGGAGTAGRARAQLENKLVRGTRTRIKFDRVNYAWDLAVLEWQPSTAYQLGDIITHLGEAYQVQEDFTSGTVFSQASLSVYADEDFTSAIDRTWAYYQPGVNQIPRNLKMLFSGLEYTGTIVDAPSFTTSAGFDTRRFDRDLFDSVEPGSDTLPDNYLDNTIQSSFQDSQLGLRPEDVTLDGAAFVDTFNSHAPEELIPGQCFDTLDLQVYTVADTANSAPPIAFRIFKNMLDETSYFRISAARITQLATTLLITDTEISLVDASVVAEPQPLETPSVPGVVFINGERITYFVRDLGENKLKQIRRGTFGTGAAQVHPVGSRVVDAHQAQLIPNATPTVWYDTVPGGQLSQDGSTLLVLTTGSGLQGSSTEQSMFLLSEPGPVVS